MALNARQISRYTDLVNIYDPGPLQLIGNHDIAQLTYPATPTFSNVQCGYLAAAELERGKFLGKENREDSPSLMDTFNFDMDQDIPPNCAIELITPGTQLLNTWFLTSGNSSVRTWRANCQITYAKRSTKPRGVT